MDSYVDAHKYVFGRRAVLYGEEDLVVAMAGFLAEFGVIPVLCASGGKSGCLEAVMREFVPQVAPECEIREGVDFEEIAEFARELAPDLLIGNSKGFKLAKELDIPLIRMGFPIHDRIGGARILHLGYAGAQQCFDVLANSLLDVKQQSSDVGFTYL